MTVEPLFALLRSALWGVKFEEKLTSEDFLLVMALAEQQTVTGLVFNQLSDQNTGADRKVVLKYAGKLSKIQRRNQLANKELLEFVNICHQHSIENMVVKGQTLASLYPNPLLRASGDIDFLIKDDYEVCRPQIERAMNVKLPSKMVDKEIAFKWNNMLYELHSNLIVFGSKKNRAYWKKLMDKEWNNTFFADVEGTPVRTLSPTMNAAYLFFHLFFHLIREGVALRQFCDWAVYLHTYKDEIDIDSLSAILVQLDMVKAFRAFGNILVHDLGLPPSSFPLEITAEDMKWRNTILRDVIKGGNFGKLNHHTTSKYKFKIETLKLATRNSFRYYSLAPTEVRVIIPRLILLNLQLMGQRIIFKG